MDLQKDEYIIVEVIPTHSDSEKGIIAQISALKLKGIKLGAPNAHFTLEQIKSASIARKQIALDNENNMRAKIMIEALLANTSNCSQIARMLNENGFRTSKNSFFDCKAVKRLIERYNLN